MDACVLVFSGCLQPDYFAVCIRRWRNSCVHYVTYYPQQVLCQVFNIFKYLIFNVLSINHILYSLFH